MEKRRRVVLMERALPRPGIFGSMFELLDLEDGDFK
jgi:hypothetical protein